VTASRGTALCASPGDCSVAMHTSVFHSAHDTASPPYPSHPEAACDPSSRPRAPETSSSARAMSLAIPLRHCTTLNAHVDFGRVGRPFLGPFLSAKRPVNGPAGGLAGACRPIELRRTAPQVQTLPSVPRLPMAEAGTPTNGIAACSAGCEIAPAQGPDRYGSSDSCTLSQSHGLSRSPASLSPVSVCLCLPLTPIRLRAPAGLSPIDCVRSSFHQRPPRHAAPAADRAIGGSGGAG
jgi:hypothetical protein